MSSVRVGVAGCGPWGRNHVRNFAELGALRAVCEPDLRNQCEVKNMLQNSNIPVYKKFESMLQDEELDAIVIATPASTHCELTLRTMEAGKHVLVEKPMALDILDCTKLVFQSKRLKKICMVGHLLEYHPAFSTMIQIVENGGLGELMYAYSNRLNLGRMRKVEDVLASFAPHDVAIMNRLFGRPREVTAACGCYIRSGHRDLITAQLKYAGQVQAHIFVSWLHPFKEHRFVVVGTHGMMVYNDISKQLVLFKHNYGTYNGDPFTTRGEAEEIVYSQQEPLRIECKHFLDCIKSGQTPLTDARSGLRVMQVLQAIGTATINNNTAYVHMDGWE